MQAEAQIGWRLVVAIADPTAYIPLNQTLKKPHASVVLPTICRALTFQCCRANYLMIFVL